MSRLADPWIAVDWGTSHLRAWRMDGGRMIDSAHAHQGMAGLERADFEPVLRGLIAPWLEAGRVLPVVACGMLGAREGWAEAPCASVPAPPLATAPVQVPGTRSDLAVWIVPGLRQERPADMMRGEETQIAGLLGLQPDFDGVLCLPGTHTKWARVSAQEVVSFQTFMTGELFAALQDHTVLRHALTGDGWDDAAFDACLAEGLSHPQRLAARLFGLRAEQLAHGSPSSVVRAGLSGLLIGAELAAARPYWLGLPVIIIGAQPLARVYDRALAAQGVAAGHADAAMMTRAGLARARLLGPGISA